MKPCKICEQPGAGNHFGVNSCRACAAFFRRGALRKLPYSCKNETQKCVIYNPIREEYSCKRCRMDKCLKEGMNVKRFQHGRDWIGPSCFRVKDEFNSGNPKYLKIVDLRPGKSFVDLKLLLREAENVFLNFVKVPLPPSSTLLKLSHALQLARDDPNPYTYQLLSKLGPNDKLLHWENSFLSVAEWFTYFDEFQQLPILIRMKMLSASWHIWSIFDRLVLNFIARKNGFASDGNILIAEHNKYLDLRNFDVDLTRFWKQYDENVNRFVTGIDWIMCNFIQPIMDLNPDSVECTFMLTQFCFNYSAKRFEGELQEISEKFQEVLANDLHNYYVNEKGTTRYSVRLGQLMKFVRSLENDFLEKQRKTDLGDVFDVWKVEFSHPEVFKDNFL